MIKFLCFLLGVSITLNIAFGIILAVILRVKYSDCGNVFKIFRDDSVADKVAMKDFFDEV